MVSERRNHPIVLFVVSSLLMTLGWWLSYFPFFIFLGIAPVFALTDRVSSVVWEKMEWVFLAISVSLWASHHFNTSYIVTSLLLGIAFTLPFIGFVWVKQILGPRVGKICIILFWLTLEYILLKLYAQDSSFLADAIKSQSVWTQWNIHTGYLGTSFWILIVNYLAYLSFLSSTPFRWYWILLTFIFLIGPPAYSYSIHVDPVSRIDMIELYSGKLPTLDATYLERGEWIVRTAAWISTLILLFTLVKSQTNKR